MRKWNNIYLRLKNIGAERYFKKLRLGRIRIREVPEWYLNDHNFCGPMWIAAFAQDKISRKRFGEDLNYLGTRIVLAKMSGNKILHNYLQEIYNSKEVEFLYWQDYFINP